MSQNLIVSITSYFPQSGKDSVVKAARELLEAKGIKTARLAFGDCLKEVTLYCCQSGQLFPEIYHKFRLALENDKDTAHPEFAIAKIGPSPYRKWLESTGHDVNTPRSARWHMWWFGTNYNREFLGKDDIWIKMVEKQIAKIHKEDSSTVIFITDTRFPLEVARLSELNAQFYCIVPVGFPKSEHHDAYEGSGIEGQLKNVPMVSIPNTFGNIELAARRLIFNMAIPLIHTSTHTHLNTYTRSFTHG